MQVITVEFVWQIIIGLGALVAFGAGFFKYIHRLIEAESSKREAELATERMKREMASSKAHGRIDQVASLLAQTREEYVKRSELDTTERKIMEAVHAITPLIRHAEAQLTGRIDRILERLPPPEQRPRNGA